MRDAPRWSDPEWERHTGRGNAQGRQAQEVGLLASDSLVDGGRRNRPDSGHCSQMSVGCTRGMWVWAHVGACE